ncbi:hypothetical protein MOQ72_27245 [Saccharopolyspora sp. K220]|uniref:hypothetical protein n=1 Tax=Saccharopolyspora soli TaxID=2926618 RepID=UPI001F57E366|nr:hypothetical protein [Saccharopolyspora soli]MCI2421145.1 hypothetical protein [Saccharopolyspora soli]
MTPPVAILPSRDEANTIAAVTMAVDAALDSPDAVIVLADASSDATTIEAFTAVPTRARTIALGDLVRGKGRQVLAAVGHLHRGGLLGGEVLLADTDTRNPDPETYRALLAPVTAGAAMALPDYQRYWDEGNLTNHLARPLIAIATGIDVPQPIAGDAALSTHATLRAIDRVAELTDDILAWNVGGYGIDAFLLLSAADTGRIVTVPINATKQHAPSFPHLPKIFTHAVPVLLHPAAHQDAVPGVIGEYRLADRTLSDQQLNKMLTTLRGLRATARHYDEQPWPDAVATAWHAVAQRQPTAAAAQRLWPAYLDHVHNWLTDGARTTLPERTATLRAGATHIVDLITTEKGSY